MLVLSERCNTLGGGLLCLKNRVMWLEGRVFTVTGVAKGIGLAYADGFSEEGAKESLLAGEGSTKTHARTIGPNVINVNCDVSQSPSAK